MVTGESELTQLKNNYSGKNKNMRWFFDEKQAVKAVISAHCNAKDNNISM